MNIQVSTSGLTLPTRTEQEARAKLRPAPLPCPFCGEDPPLAAEKIGPSSFRNFIVGCENEDCPAEPKVSGHTVAEAWKKWNTRAKPQSENTSEARHG